MITRYNEVKLIDFGAAKQSNLDGKSLSIVLKQGFAPEEQYRTHGEQGPWTDVYALGATIYFCLTGQLPVESIQRMVKDTIKRPSELGAVITSGQENALMKSLAVYKRNRYDNVQQMMNGLYNPRNTAVRPTVPTTRPSTPRPTGKTTAKVAPKPAVKAPTASRLNTTKKK